jgi:MoaA/NifB/PqqE/SkfB family radical SAM enzyme
MQALLSQSLDLDGALLQVNRFCNARCSHCSQSAPLVHRGASLLELSSEDWAKALDRLKSVGIRRVRFTGGEPFLRPDIEDLSWLAVEKDLEVSYVTNGQLVLRHLEWLREVKPSSLWISVYGFPALLYEQVSGLRGGLERIAHTVPALLESDIRVGFYFPVGNMTYDSVGTFTLFAYLLGVRSLKFLQVLPHGRASAKAGLGPAPLDAIEGVASQLADVHKQCPGLKIKLSMQSNQRSVLTRCGFRVPSDVTCHAGLQRLWTLDSVGGVLPCCLFLNKEGSQLFNIRDSDALFNWQSWSTSTVLHALSVQEPVRACPALGPFCEDRPEELSEFICPLTFAELG